MLLWVGKQSSQSLFCQTIANWSLNSSDIDYDYSIDYDYDRDYNDDHDHNYSIDYDWLW